MNILMAHNYYRTANPSGEDKSFEAEASMLEDHGHTVTRYTRCSDEILDRGARGKVSAFGSSIWSRKAYQDISGLIQEHRIEMAHFQNTHPLLSPSVYDACKAHGVPVVQALRNFRLLCPSGMYLRDQKLCERCRDLRFKTPAIRYKCYQGSRTGSLAMASMLLLHALRKTWLTRIQAFVTPSQIVIDKFNEAGWDTSSFFVKPNIVGVPTTPSPCPTDSYAMYVGRLSEEKGIRCMLKAFEKMPHRKLLIAGSGALEGEVRQAAEQAGSNIEFVGRIPLEQALIYLQGSSFLVFPSIWYETFGRTILEAFTCGRPVIASNLGAMAELVRHEHNGLLFEPNSTSGLIHAAEQLWNNPQLLSALGQTAAADSQTRYPRSRNYEILRQVYDFAKEKMSDA